MLALINTEAGMTRTRKVAMMVMMALEDHAILQAVVLRIGKWHLISIADQVSWLNPTSLLVAME